MSHYVTPGMTREQIEARLADILPYVRDGYATEVLELRRALYRMAAPDAAPTVSVRDSIPPSSLEPSVGGCTSCRFEHHCILPRKAGCKAFAPERRSTPRMTLSQEEAVNAEIHDNRSEV